MLISPPFLPPRAANQTEEQWLEAAMSGGEPGKGAYPVSYNLGWHGGLHLRAPARGSAGVEPVCAIADGVIVFCRGSSEPPAAPAPDAPLSYDGRTSDGVVIIRHETEIGASRQGHVPTRVVFFSIYMHLNTVRNTVLLGRPVQRKAELGQAGYIRGRPHQIHFEIICDDENLEKLVGRSTGLVPLTGDGRSDAVFGEIYFHLAATTLVYPERPPRNRADFAGGVPLGEELFVGLRYAQGDGSKESRGHAYVTTYRPTGKPLAEELTETDAEYNLHREVHNIVEAYPANARPSPSAVYELLRFGRVMGPDALVPPDIPHWRRVRTPAGTRWVNLSAQEVRKFSDADFPHWRGWHLIEDTRDGDCLCNEPAILRVADVNCDGPVDMHEAHSRLAAPEAKTLLKRLICKFPTEWEAAKFDARWGWLKALSPANPNPMSDDQFARLRAHVEALAFWENANLRVPKYDSQGRPVGERPLSRTHWRIDPREFVRVFRKSGWLSLSEFKQIYPPTPIEVLQRYYVHLNIMMRKYLVSNGSRQSHFLGQGAVESDFLRAMQERSMEGQNETRRVLGRRINSRSAQPEDELGHWYGSDNGESDPWFSLEKYNSRGVRIAGSYSWRNGNCGDVDAQKFRGRGFKQITGLDNYSEYWVYRGWLSRASFTPSWWDDPAYGRRDAARMTRRPAQIDNPHFVAVDSYSCIDSGGWYMTFRRPNVIRSIDEDAKGIAASQAEGAAESAVSRRVTYAINGGYNDDTKRLECTRLAKKSDFMNFSMFVHIIVAFSAFGVFPLADAAEAYDFKLDAQRHNVAIAGETGVLRVCRFPQQVEFAHASFDGSALIVSATEYVPVRDLLLCGRDPIKFRLIPLNVGSLVDVNLAHGIYLTVDFISVSPLRFLATVARIGDSRSIVDIPGSYNSSLPLRRLRKQGFSYDESRARGRISPDGNYVAPNGEIDCSAHAYPGVWDIKGNRRVRVPKNVDAQGDDAGREWCRSLFGNLPPVVK